MYYVIFEQKRSNQISNSISELTRPGRQISDSKSGLTSLGQMSYFPFELKRQVKFKTPFLN